MTQEMRDRIAAVLRGNISLDAGTAAHRALEEFVAGEVARLEPLIDSWIAHAREHARQQMRERGCGGAEEEIL
jgi:hypothetical protein